MCNPPSAHMKVSQFFLVILCLSSTACIPVRMQAGKHIEGTVLNKSTGEPIVGAQVMYCRNPKTAVLTDQMGSFTLERTNVTFWAPLLPIDYFGYYHFPVVAKAKGYQSQT